MNDLASFAFPLRSPTTRIELFIPFYEFPGTLQLLQDTSQNNAPKGPTIQHPKDNEQALIPKSSSKKTKKTLKFNPWLSGQSIKRGFLGLLSLTGFGIYLFDLLTDGSTDVMSQICLRLGIVLGTLWLAFPQLELIFRNFSVGILIVILLVTFVIAKNPIILLLVVALCVLLGIGNYFFRVFNGN